VFQKMHCGLYNS